jgi:metal-sulfur cluster biosynthetic enzyme
MPKPLDDHDLRSEVVERLRSVIDPETQVDVIRMRLVEDLMVDTSGQASYTFRPSSPLCPIAVHLAQQIKQAVAEAPGITCQQIAVKDYFAAEQLTTLINDDETGPSWPVPGHFKL